MGLMFRVYIGGRVNVYVELGMVLGAMINRSLCMELLIRWGLVFIARLEVCSLLPGFSWMGAVSSTTSANFMEW